MAIRNKTNLPLAPIPYTKEIDNGTDFTALANSTYFKDTTDGLVYFKDGTGTKISLFESGGDNIYTADGTLIAARTVTMAGFGLNFEGGQTLIKGVNTLSGTKGLIVENSLGAAALTVTNDGNVGIGVNAATPTEKLTVDGALAFSYTSLGVTANGIKRNGVYTDYYNTIASTGTLIAHQFTVTGSAAAMTILQGKNVGIGITAPTAKLHVVGSTLLDGNLGVFGTTPIAQPTTGVASSVIVAGAGTNALQDDTYGGYTMAQVVQALQNLGVLA